MVVYGSCGPSSQTSLEPWRETVYTRWRRVRPEVVCGSFAPFWTILLSVTRRLCRDAESYPPVAGGVLSSSTVLRTCCRT